jgi:hypothetical protein
MASGRPRGTRAPQKYHVTVSRARVEIIGHHADRRDKDFTAFTARCPAVLEQRLLTPHYAPATLASQRARSGWAEPDLVPSPWCPRSQFRPQ